jgi:hypothetical protein
MQDGITFILNRREKIVKQFYDKILLAFDNDNEVKFATEGTFSFPLAMIPEVHLAPLLDKLREGGLYVYPFIEEEVTKLWRYETPEDAASDNKTWKEVTLKKRYYKVLLEELRFEHKIYLEESDFKQLEEEIKTPQEPNENLKKAAKRRKKNE